MDISGVGSAITDGRHSVAKELTRSGVSTATRPIDRLVAAHDASHYLLTPLAVVSPRNADQVARILAVARQKNVPITLRSGGTSLSGQAGGDGLLVDVRKHFRRIRVLESGARVQAQPGATVRAVNARLMRHGRALGPDPASEVACTVGGVVANNSSGMSCGIERNAYQTLDGSVLVLPTGTIIDTGADGAEERLRLHEPALAAGLIRLRDRIRRDSRTVERIRALHSIKNTMGYGLNSFLDHDDAVQILEHLVVGSEGTLAFVAEATFRTVSLRPHRAAALLVFASMADATHSLPQLVQAGFAAIELMDAASLRIAQRNPQAVDSLKQLKVSAHVALLVEYQADSAEELSERIAEAPTLFARLPIVADPMLTADRETRARLWHIRKGLFTAVAGARRSGSTALLEDIAVPVEQLGQTCDQLIRLFDKHEYQGSAIFGHARDGNIHFLLNEQFDQPRRLKRYESFTEDMVDLVLAQNGTLKAEHGTGRVMAPYVRRQVGDELYDVMWEVKRLVDPDSILNPGVLLSNDPKAHMRHLKVSPSVDREVDRCVECGYCEPGCPSRDLTLTPRGRIVVRREITRAHADGDQALATSLEQDFQYDGLDTCAVDGMCENSCPVSINTGDLIRRLRQEGQTRLQQSVWKHAANHWDGFTVAAGIGLTAAKRLPPVAPAAGTRAMRAIFGPENMPLYTKDLPPGGRRRQQVRSANPVAVYFSSCTTTMFEEPDDDGVAGAFLRLCARADIDVSTPPALPSLCCGTPWKSKGLTKGYELMRVRVVTSLLEATDNGQIPVVCDASSCTEGLRALLDASETANLNVIDAVQFVAEHVVPQLPKLNRLDSVTLHPTCSSTRLGINGVLKQVAEAAADTVIVPDDWACCGFAGDRGMLHPQLTRSATTDEAAECAASPTARYASLNRTCEIGMTRATGQTYRHVLQLLDAALSQTEEQLSQREASA